jgi:sodium transport system ATP-binding protein
MSSNLEVMNIKKTFNLSRKQRKIEKTEQKKKVAVNDLSFIAYPGEIYGLLGPNGAGKTTTLRIISTLINADEGDVLVGGASVVNDPFQVRNKIGFLTSELKLEDHFTPSYLFDYFSKLHGVDETTMKKRKQRLFEQFGIDNFEEVKVADLSTGMKQKASLAISLVHDPAYIIFDEPTNGLDVLTAKNVTDYLIKLRDEGKTVIISTHILSVVEKICDRVGIIIDGEMKMTDTLKNIKESDDYVDLETVFFNLLESGDTNE